MGETRRDQRTAGGSGDGDDGDILADEGDEDEDEDADADAAARGGDERPGPSLVAAAMVLIV